MITPDTPVDICEAYRIHRWNLSIRDGEIWACLGAHPRNNECDEIKLSPERLVEIIKKLGATCVRMNEETS